WSPFVGVTVVLPRLFPGDGAIPTRARLILGRKRLCVSRGCGQSADGTNLSGRNPFVITVFKAEVVHVIAAAVHIDDARFVPVTFRPDVDATTDLRINLALRRTNQHRRGKISGSYKNRPLPFGKRHVVSDVCDQHRARTAEVLLDVSHNRVGGPAIDIVTGIVCREVRGALVVGLVTVTG